MAGKQRKKKASPKASRSAVTIPASFMASPVGFALARARKLNAQELQTLLEPLRTAVTAYRDAQMTHDHWNDLDGAAELSRRVERLGVVKGLGEEIGRFKSTLQALKTTASPLGSDEWTAPVPTPATAATLDELVQIHEFQLSQLSMNEFRKVVLQTAQTHLPGALSAYHAGPGN